MNESCVLIPSNNGKPSKLFMDLYSLLGDRSKALELYSIASQKEFQDLYKLKLENGEPVAADVIKTAGNPEKILGSNKFKEFISQEEDLDQKFDTYEEAFSEFQNLRRKYPENVFSITSDRDGYIISVLDESSRETMNAEERNGIIFNKIKSYLRHLGFSLSEDSTVLNRSRFSPKEAEKDADNLINIIRIARSKKGVEDLPEEFGHLVIEGMSDSPLVRRLLGILNDDSIRQILGDKYQSYFDFYSNLVEKDNRFTVQELLTREAAGKLLGDVLRDKILGKDIPIAERLAAMGLRRFALGKEADIKSIIEEAYESMDVIAENIVNNDFRKIDINKILSGPSLYNIEKKVSDLEKTAREAYFTMVKKMKIFASRRKSSNWDSEELKTVRKMKKYLDAKQYVESIYAFMDYVLGDVRRLKKRIQEYNDTLSSDGTVTLMELRKLGRLLRTVSGTITAYEGIIDTLSGIEDWKGVSEELEDADIADIGNAASDISQVMGRLKGVYKRVRKTSLVQFFRYTWGDKKTIQTLNGETEFTVEDILKDATSDISMVSRMLNSLEDMSDPLLTVVDSVYKKLFYSRDVKINKISQEIKAIHDDYVRKTGSNDTSFIFVMDENGVPTGMLKSDRDWKKYFEEKAQFIQDLKDKGLSEVEIRSRIRKWNNDHRETVEVRNGFKEAMPKKELYPSDDLKNFTEAQREYYDKMMALKQELDSLLPDRNVRTYRAIQKRTSTGDALMNAAREGRGIRTLKQMFGALKQKVASTVDDTEYGEGETTGDGMETIIDPITGELVTPDMQRQILIDFGGNPVAKIPVPYTRKLEDMNYLSLDFTDSLLAYASSALNYDSMSKIADMMEVLKEYVGDRMIQQRAGEKSLFEGFTVAGEKIKKDYKKKGIGSQIYLALEHAIQKNTYGRKRKEEKVYMGKNEINYGKIGDTLIGFGTQNSMGYNIFSSLSNVTMGNVQLLLEAVGNTVSKEGFGLKDILFGIKEYVANIPDLIHGYFQNNQSKKIALLVKEFDPREENYGKTHSENTGRGGFSRIISALGPMQGQALGENYLHNVIMLATLHNIKVKVTEGNEQKEVSLLDAFEVKEITTSSGNISYELSLPENIDFGNELESVQENLYKIRRLIQGASHSINGAYSETDKGEIHKYVFGRMLTNYRQWMPAFVMNRFKSKRYNDVREREEEGFYNTMMKFVWSNIKDLFHLKIQIATRWHSLSKYRKGNIVKALTEMTLYALLAFALNKSGAPDDDDPYVANMVRYLGYRLKVELGSASPFNVDFFDNAQSLLRSPLPALEKTDYLINLLAFWDLGDTIESGKYEGWNRYMRNLYYTIPYMRNIGRAIDMGKGDFEMFNIYLKNQ